MWLACGGERQGHGREPITQGTAAVAKIAVLKSA